MATYHKVMKTKEYKDFSWKLHQRVGHKPIVAQIELTYRCPLHCKHCYTDCYNSAEYSKKELSTKGVKKLLDKCKQANTVWLCFTGGDPLMREDFSEIYLYAKEQGFIVSIFSSLVTMDKKILDLFEEFPPFNIETTLNAATARTYRAITERDLFKKQVDSIKQLIANNIEVRVKTQVTKQNIGEIDKMQSLVERLGKQFRSSTMLFARLNRDTSPCKLRLEPKEAIRVNKKYGYYDEQCSPAGEKLESETMITEPSGKLFSCAIGGHAFTVSPEGVMRLCNCLIDPSYDLLEKGASVNSGFYALHKKIHAMKFKTDSTCRACKDMLICQWCPARALLENGSLEKPIEYFCKMTSLIQDCSKIEKI